MVGRYISLWDGLFSGAMLVSGMVNYLSTGDQRLLQWKPPNFCPFDQRPTRPKSDQKAAVPIWADFVFLFHFSLPLVSELPSVALKAFGKSFPQSLQGQEVGLLLWWMGTFSNMLSHGSEIPRSPVDRQLKSVLSHDLQGFYTSLVVQDFFHQQ